MQISNKHNLIDAPADTEHQFGIRVTVPKTDPFSRLVSADWSTYHWFATAIERDQAIEEKSARHRFSRIGDAPTVQYEPVNR
jgi:hypothetical protein